MVYTMSFGKCSHFQIESSKMTRKLVKKYWKYLKKNIKFSDNVKVRLEKRINQEDLDQDKYVLDAESLVSIGI